MMKLGFVGVGKHAQKMAAAFREYGAEVVAFDRKGAGNIEPPTGFGPWIGWRDQIVDPNVNALVICAPPAATTEVALACAQAGKRCVATKPLMVSDPGLLWPADERHLPKRADIMRARGACGTPAFVVEAGGFDPNAAVYVDLWRLYSPSWQALKAELQGKQIQSVHVDFYGKGPVRDFSGLLDYGPHALAFVADLLGEIPAMTWKHEVDTHRGRNHCAWGKGERVNVVTGNGFPTPGNSMQVVVKAGGIEFLWRELSTSGKHQFFGQDDLLILECERSLALRNFCRAFLAGESSDTLRISCEAMKALMPLVS